MKIWTELADALRDATGPGMELDARIALALGWRHTSAWGPQWWYNTNRQPVAELPHFTDTLHIGQIIKVIGERLPGWAWKVGTCSVSDDAWIVPDFNCPEHGTRLRQQFFPIQQGGIWDNGIDIDRRPSGQPALALCEAFCRAMGEVAG